YDTSSAHRHLPSFPTRRSSDLDPPLHGPVELAQVRRGDGGGGGGAASLGLAPRPLQRHDAVVQGHLVALELGQALQRLARSAPRDRKSTRLNSSHVAISYAVFR